MTPAEWREALHAAELRNARAAGIEEGRRVARDSLLNDLARLSMRFDNAAAEAIWECIGLLRKAGTP